MKTNIVISLDTRRSKQDGTYPLVMRLGHHRKTIPMPLGISLKEMDWDDRKRLIRKTYSGSESVTRLNNLIQKKKSEAMDKIVKLNENGLLDSMSILELKKKLSDKNEHQSFISFSEQLVKELTKANRFGTANSYKQVLGLLKKFNNNRDILFRDINYSFLIRFETNHFAKGNSANGLAVYMRTIRSIYNKAINTGVADKDLYPFDSYKIKTTPTEKRALEWEQLRKIFELDLPKNHPCYNARNYFVASYMMYGMNFADMAQLRKSDIKDGRLLYRRKKTGKFYDIKVTPQLKKLFDFYAEQTSESEFIFPIITREQPRLQDKDVLWARKRYNKKLKLIAEDCEIEQNLTSYVSRHSFATQALFINVPVNAISAMLGHSNIKTTEIYLKSLPSKTLDDFNEKILKDQFALG